MNLKHEISLYRLICRIEKSYGIYIGTKSLTFLWIFLLGYEQRLFDEEKYVCAFRQEFQIFVEKYYDQAGGYSWADLIKGTLQENEAFDDFFKMFKQFLQDSEYGRILTNYDQSIQSQQSEAIRGRFSD